MREAEFSIYGDAPGVIWYRAKDESVKQQIRDALNASINRVGVKQFKLSSVYKDILIGTRVGKSALSDYIDYENMPDLRVLMTLEESQLIFNAVSPNPQDFDTIEHTLQDFQSQCIELDYPDIYKLIFFQQSFPELEGSNISVSFTKPNKVVLLNKGDNIKGKLEEIQSLFNHIQQSCLVVKNFTNSKHAEIYRERIHQYVKAGDLGMNAHVYAMYHDRDYWLMADEPSVVIYIPDDTIRESFAKRTDDIRDKETYVMNVGDRVSLITGDLNSHVMDISKHTACTFKCEMTSGHCSFCGQPSGIEKAKKIIHHIISKAVEFELHPKEYGMLAANKSWNVAKIRLESQCCVQTTQRVDPTLQIYGSAQNMKKAQQIVEDMFGRSLSQPFQRSQCRCSHCKAQLKEN